MLNQVARLESSIEHPTLHRHLGLPSYLIRTWTCSVTSSHLMPCRPSQHSQLGDLGSCRPKTEHFPAQYLSMRYKKIHLSTPLPTCLFEICPGLEFWCATAMSVVTVSPYASGKAFAKPNYSKSKRGTSVLFRATWETLSQLEPLEENMAWLWHRGLSQSWEEVLRGVGNLSLFCMHSTAWMLT